MALSKDRNTPVRRDDQYSYDVAAGAHIYAGALVVLDDGYAKPGEEASGLTAVGRSDAPCDNSDGADGDATVEVRRGVFRYINDDGDSIAAEDVGSTAYIVDDETVAKTDGGGTRSPAGHVRQVDDDGVWIAI